MITDFFNVYIDQLYPGLLVLWLLPLYWGCVILVQNCRSASKEGRNKLKIGVLLALFTACVIYMWTMIYYVQMYGHLNVFEGTGSYIYNDYRSIPKEEYIFK